MKDYDVIIIGAGPSGIFCACRLKELDPDITPDDIRDLSMRKIQDLIDSLSGGESNSSDGNAAVPDSTGVSDDTDGEGGHHSEEHEGGQENRHRHNR